MSLSNVSFDDESIIDELLFEDDIDISVYASLAEYLKGNEWKRRNTEIRRNYIASEWGRILWGANVTPLNTLFDISTGRCVNSYNGELYNVESRTHKLFVRRFQATSNIREKRFSEWIESVRKDVECAFGILKLRFRYLKNPIRF
jgi:hypothetical protein